MTCSFCSHAVTIQYHITGLFPEVQIFSNAEPLALAEIFLILEIPEPGTLIRSRDGHFTKFYRSIVRAITHANRYTITT